MNAIPPWIQIYNFQKLFKRCAMRILSKPTQNLHNIGTVIHKLLNTSYIHLLALYIRLTFLTALPDYMNTPEATRDIGGDAIGMKIYGTGLYAEYQ